MPFWVGDSTVRFLAEFTLSGVTFFDKLRMNGEKGSE
jgi:hypothetical protein